MEMLGGERLDWRAHLKPRKIWGNRATSLEVLLERIVTKSNCLVVGTHSPDLIRLLLSQGVTVDVVDPSPDSAQAIDAELNEFSNLRVYCGDVQRFVSGEKYDAVVATNGLRGTVTPDSDIQTPGALLEFLSNLVAKKGCLVIGIDNTYGFRQTLGGFDADFSQHADDAWPRGSRANRAETIRDVLALAEGSGMKIIAQYAVFGDLDSPNVIATWNSMENGRDGFLANHVASAVAASFSNEPSLADPYLSVKQSVFAESAFDLASGRIVVCAEEDQKSLDIPAAIVTDSITNTSIQATWFGELEGQGLLWKAWDKCTTGGQIVARDFQRSPRSDQCETLENKLLWQIRQFDREGYSLSIAHYLDFLGSAKVQAGKGVFAELANVTMDDSGNIELIDSSWSYSERASIGAIQLMHLRSFARLVLTSGFSTPWGGAASIDQLAFRIAAVHGVDIRDSRDEASALRGKIDLTLNGDGIDKVDVYVDEVSAVSSRPLGPSGPSAGTTRDQINAQTRVDELITLCRSQERELLALRERLRLTRIKLKRAQDRAKIETRKNRRIKESRSYRVGHAIGKPFRGVKKTAKK